MAIGASAGVGLFVPHRRLFWGSCSGLGAPPVAEVFRFGAPSLPVLALALGTGLLAGGWRGVVRALRASRWLRRVKTGPASSAIQP